jgi:N6-adenosine-specific RNA methylase IME4
LTTLAQYEEARAALAKATMVDEVVDIHDEVEHIKLYARQIKDQSLLADASAFQMRVERRLGEVLLAAKDSGYIRQGARPKGPGGGPLEPIAPTLAELGVSKNLSSRAQKRASISERAFENMIEGVRHRIAAGHATVIDREASKEEKRTRRESRERVLGMWQAALPDEKFGVIVADPEWRFEQWSKQTGMDRAADNHYPTSSIDVIMSRPIDRIAAPDCVLFLWATVPMLRQALATMDAWGFDYKSHFVWVKDKIGTGYWNRNKHELLLIGTKGDIPAPAMGEQLPSALEFPAGEHSAKPEDFLRIIEEYFPTLPKIELNRRGEARPGWKAWGNEAEPPIYTAEQCRFIDENGMVTVDATHVIAAAFVSAEEWAVVLGHDAKTGEIIETPQAAE